MKKLFFSALVLCASAAFAGQVTIMERPMPIMDNFNTMSDVSFQMDTRTTEGFVRVTVTEERFVNSGGYYDQWGHYYPNRIPMPVTILNETVKVEGLMLMGDKVVYHGADGVAVECGTLGESHVLHLPTIYLTGNCKLSSRITGNWNNAKLVVTMTTK